MDAALGKHGKALVLKFNSFLVARGAVIVIVIPLAGSVRHLQHLAVPLDTSC